MLDVYSDGGCVGRNPSELAGTWCWCHVEQGELVRGHCGHITQAVMGTKKVSNNQTEMLAALYALQSLQNEALITLHSDSAVTLGRLFSGWRWKNIPLWMIEMYRAQKLRLVNWHKFKAVLVAGHPTRQQLAAGVGKNGLPVSEWNQWCDIGCQEAARDFMAGWRKELEPPSQFIRS